MMMMTRIILLLICCWINGILTYPYMANEAAYPYQPNQPIDVSGAHAYQSPGPNDQRGPCPGFNALANHGFVNRSGIPKIKEAFDVAILLGLSVEVANIIGVLSILASNGDVFSIGNGSLSTGPGFNKHNYIEGDASYTRCDCNMCPTTNGCDNFNFNDTVWSTTHKEAQLNGNLYNITTFQEAAKKRYDECRTNNSQCYFGPVQFVLHYATPCAWILLFPNGTNGIPTEEIVNTWTGISKAANGTRSGIPGGGRIPDNWYPPQTPLTLDVLLECAKEIYSAHPVTLGRNINGMFFPHLVKIPASPSKRDIACLTYNAILSIVPLALITSITNILNPIFVSGSWNCSLVNIFG